jgi:transcriptional regulator with XRE-family HTH domain
MYDRALKTIRQYHRLSQADLADQLAMSKSYLNEIERGRKEPSLEILRKYAKRFDLKLSSLMLFAERSENSTYDRARVFAADKVLKMLEWMAEGAENEQSKEELTRSAHTG